MQNEKIKNNYLKKIEKFKDYNKNYYENKNQLVSQDFISPLIQKIHFIR